MTPAYLDHFATTPVDPRVLEAMLPYFTERFGNPASRTHAYGREAEEAVEAARAEVAALVGAEPAEIVFTSGTTESNNLAIQGVAALRGRPGRLVTAATEHPSVLDPVRVLERRGWQAAVLPVDAEGLLHPDAVAEALSPETALLSVMAANNEIGVLQPVSEISALARARGVPFHCDAAQAVGKEPFDVRALGADFVSFSAHKLYGPKGAGALFVRKSRPRARLLPLFEGGGHERGLRPGTPNVPALVGFGKACALRRAEMEAERPRLAALRDRLREALRAGLDGIRFNGHPVRRLAGSLHASFEGIDGDALIPGLEGIAVSAGSACTSASLEPSHVLKALGLPADLARASIRFGLGRLTTEREVDLAAAEVIRRVRQLRAKQVPVSVRPQEKEALR